MARLTRSLLVIIIFSAFLASLGNPPYAWRFTGHLVQFGWFYLLFALIFVITATGANIALGVYSLLEALNKHIAIMQRVGILFIALLAAIPLGFICYVGYKSLLPVPLNVTISIMVIIVNAGINFTAMKNILDDFGKAIMRVTNHSNEFIEFVTRMDPKKMTQQFNTILLKYKVIDHYHNLKSIYRILKNMNKRAFARVNNELLTIYKYHNKPIRGELTLSLLGFLLGLCVTTTVYLAGTNGLAMLFLTARLNQHDALRFSFIFAIVLWLPGAALFANSSRKVFATVYHSIMKFSKHSLSTYNVIFIIIAILSGSSFAQMTYEFFDPNKYIPTFFKQTQVILLSHTVLVPVALLCSAAVNAVALTNLINQYRSYRTLRINSSYHDLVQLLKNRLHH